MLGVEIIMVKEKKKDDFQPLSPQVQELSNPTLQQVIFRYKTSNNNKNKIKWPSLGKMD